MEVHEAPALKQEALYRALFETTQDAVLIADAKTGQILEANPAAERLFGYDRARLCRMHQTELHPAELATSYRKKFRRFVEAGAFRERGLIVQHADGSWIPVELSGQVLEVGGRKLLQSVFRDLRELQRLTETEALYRTLFETSLAGIYLLQDGRIVVANPQAAAIFGYTPEEIIGLPVAAVVAEEDRELVAENIRRRMTGEVEEIRYRFRGRRKDGSRFWVEVRGRRILYNGRPAILGTVLDVDEQVRTMEQLAQSEARYRRLFEHHVAGFYRTTVDGKILRVNPALAHMLGYDDPAELEGQPASMLYMEEADRVQFLEALRREGRLVNYEVRLRRKDGRVLWGLENVLLVQEPDGTECVEGTLINLTELLEQRRRYLGLYEHTEDAIFWVRVTEDGQFLIEATNPSHQRKTGLTPEQLWNRPLDEVLPPDIVAHVTGNYRRCLEAGHPIEYEETLDLPAGRRTWLTQLVPIPDPDGRIRLIAGIARDITELRRLQALLEEEGLFLEQFVSGASRKTLCVRLCRVAERFIEGARASVWQYAEGRLHLCAAPALPEAFQTLFDGQLIGSNQGSLGAAAFSRQPVWVSDIAKDPRWSAFREQALAQGLRACWGVPFFGRQGELLGVLGLCFDQVRAPTPDEQAVVARLAHLAGVGLAKVQLQEERERLARVVAQISEGVVLTDTVGTVVWINEAFTRLTGYRPDEVLGKNIEQLLHGPETDRDTLRRMRLRLLRGRPAHARLYHYRKDRSGFWDEVHIDLLYDEHGQHIGYIGLMADVTELVEAEQQLKTAKERAEEASRLKSAFLANMSHEIRTPLTGILGFAELLDEELGARKQEDLREFTQIIDRSARRLLTLLNDLLDLSKIEANRLELQLQATDVVEVARQAVQLMQPLAEEKGVQLKLQVRRPPLAWADPNRVHQILVNLLSNAIKFTDEGHVQVQIGRKQGRVWLAVEDTGCGINPSFLPHLFEPFRQEHEGLTQTHHGVGLGLAIVKRLVDLMDGQIAVHSTPGQGTCFEVLLPRAPDQACHSSSR
ncbi:PAS domain S-box protein [Rhodothermus profundi]|uniref:histidine kinase n=1 Tax=Rhodothermus profundi TaxID=633813 RepID=A0A1M6P2Y6_9BACT|nr:PAS domain S-box protein [Rhodothermus profundi]SHK02300.1 PAS domain S-box-containing protein [Rhodothermus profundi]